MITLLAWLAGGSAGLLMFVLGWIAVGNWLHLRERKRLLNAVRKFVNNPDNRGLMAKLSVKIHHIIQMISAEDFERAKRELRVLGVPF